MNSTIYLGKVYISKLNRTRFRFHSWQIVVLVCLLCVVAVANGAPSNYLISNYAGIGTLSSVGDGGKATAAGLPDACSVFADSLGNTYLGQCGSIVRKVDTNDIISVYGGRAAAAYTDGDNGPVSSATFHVAYGVWGDSTGRIFINDNTDCNIRVVTSGIITNYAGTGTCTISGNGGKATSAALYNPSFVTGDTTGRLFLSDGSYEVRIIEAYQIIRTYLGTGSLIYSGSSGPATSASVGLITGLSIDTAGQLFCSDYSFGSVYKIDNVQKFSVVAGIGSNNNYNGDGIPATSAILYNPVGVGVDSAGNVFVADYGTYRIRQLTSSLLYSIAGTGGTSNTGDGGMATSAGFVSMWGLWASSTSSVLVTSRQYVVRKLTALVPTVIPTNMPTALPSVAPSCIPTVKPSVIPTVTPSILPTYVPTVVPSVYVPVPYMIFAYAGTSVQGNTGDGGKATAAMIADVCSIFIDSMGNTYFADCNTRVRKIDTSDIITTVGGISSSVSAGDGGPVSSATFKQSYGIWGDSAGTLFLVDRTAFVVRSVSSSTSIISAFAGIVASQGSSGDNGPATSAFLDSMRFLAGDTAGRIYIAVDASHKIRMVQNQIITTFVGTGTLGSNGDGGKATAAAINVPVGVFADSNGFVYFADYTAGNIRKVDSSQIISTIAGLNSGSASDGIAATSAVLSSPRSVFVDNVGSLLFCEQGSKKVRVISTSIVYTIGGNGGGTDTGDGGLATQASIASPPAIWQSSVSTILVGGSLVVRKMIPLTPTVSPTRMPTTKPTCAPTTTAPSYAPVASPTSYLITTLAGTGTSGTTGDGGPASAATLFNSIGLFTDSVGATYITDGFSRVRKVDASGIISTFVGSSVPASSGDGGQASSSSFNMPYAVWGDSTGRVFITDTNGYTVRVVSTGGIVSVYAGNGSPVTSPTASNGDNGQATSATIDKIMFLAGDSVGNLYLSPTTTALYKIRKIYAGIITTIAGTGTSALGADSIPATSSSLAAPQGLFADSVGKLYIVESSGSTVRLLSTSQVFSRFAGDGNSRFNGDGGVAASSSLSSPRSIYGDVSDRIFIADLSNSRYRSVVTGTLYTVAGTGASSNTGDGGFATAATISNPWGVWGDSAGNLVVAGVSTYLVRKLTSLSPTALPTTAPSAPPTIVPTVTPTNSPVVAPVVYLVVAFAGTGGTSVSGDGGPATSAELYLAICVFVDSVGSTYMTDSSKRVRKVDSNGIITTFAGSSLSTSTGDGGQASNAGINLPFGVWADSVGRLFVGDQGGCVIRVVSVAGIIFTYAGNGNSLSNPSIANGDGGQATSATIGITNHFAGDSNGNLYFSSNQQNKVRMIGANGIITTIVGTGISGGGVDNIPASATTLYSVQGVFADSVGKLFVVDSFDAVVRMVSTSLIITRFAGTASNTFNGDGLAATSTSLNSPRAIFADSSANAFVMDRSNNRIRLIVSNTVYTVCGNGGTTNTGNDGYATASSINNVLDLWGDTVSNVVFTGAGMMRKLINLSPSVSPTIVPSAVPSFTPVAAPTMYLSTAYAGTGSSVHCCDGGPATSAGFANSFGVFVDSVGVSYIADSVSRVRKVDVNGIISTFMGSATAGSFGDGGPATSGTLNGPYAVWGDSLGQIFIADAISRKIRVVSGGIVYNYAGNGSPASAPTSTNGDGGRATAAVIDAVYFLAGDSAGRLYLSCSNMYKVRMVTSGGLISTVVGSGSNALGSDNIAATASTLSSVQDVFADSIGKLYVGEATNSVIRIVSADQIISHFAGSGIGDFNGDGLVATSCSLRSPRGIFGDAKGNIFLADYINKRFRLVTNNVMYTIAGNGVALATSDDIAATAATFANAHGIWGDTLGSLFVSKANGYVIKKLINNSPTFVPTLVPSKSPTAIPSSPPVAAPSTFLVSAFVGLGTSGHTGDGGKATSAQIGKPYSSFQDTGGNTYVGDITFNFVRSIDSSNIIKTFCGTGSSSTSGNGGPASSASVWGPLGVWGDSIGNLYISEYNSYIVRKVDTAMIISAFAGIGTTGFGGDGGPATSASITKPYFVFGNSGGNLYLADPNNERIRVITGGVMNTFAGNGGYSVGPDGVAASASTLENPMGIFVDTSGNVYFAERDLCRVRKVAASTTLLSTIAGNGNSGFNGDGLVATSCQLSFLYGVYLDSIANVYLSDSFNNRIRFIPANSNVMYTIAGSGSMGSTGNDGPATSASFQTPVHVSGNAAGRLLISTDENQVRMLSNLAPTVSPSARPSVAPSMAPSVNPTSPPVVAPSIFIIAAFAGGATGYGGDGGKATSALIGTNYANYQDSVGMAYVSDITNNVIRSIDTSNIIRTIIGSSAASSLGDGGPATTASINGPTGVWGDSMGNIYVAEYKGYKLRKVDSSLIVSLFAGIGSIYYSGDDAPATAAGLYPSCVFGNTAGVVYVADVSGNRIRIIASGIISTLVGNGAFSYGSDGVSATSSPLQTPLGMFVDTAGTLYFAEGNGSRVRKVAAGSTIMSTIAGNGNAGFIGDGLAATASWLNVVYGVCLDTTFNIYMVDYGNSRIRFIPVNSNILYTVVGTGVSASNGNDGPATAASLKYPFYISSNNAGRILISEFAVRSLAMVVPTSIPSVKPSIVPSIVPSSPPVPAPSTFLVSAFAGIGAYGYTGDGGKATGAMIGAPVSSFQDTVGNTYFPDMSYHYVRSVDSANMIKTVIGTGVASTLGNGGPATSASVDAPRGVWADTVGNLYFADSNGCVVRKIDSSLIVSVVAGNGVKAYSGDGGSATSASLYTSNYIYGSSDGKLYLPDAGDKIRVITSGIISLYAGNGFYSYGSDGLVATSSPLQTPMGVFVDAIGNVYFAEANGSRIRKIAVGTSILSTIAGQGNFGFIGDGLAATSSWLNIPYGIFLDSVSNVYISDSYNYRVRMIPVNSNLLYTVAGTGIAGGVGNNVPATSASFMRILHVSGNSAGRLLITSDEHAMVRMLSSLNPTVSPTVTPSATPSFPPVAAPSTYLISAFAGVLNSYGSTGNNGKATSAKIGSPTSSFQYSAGSALITDSSFHVIRSVSSTNIISIFLGNQLASSSGNGGPATSASINYPLGVWGDSAGNVFVSEYTGFYVRKVDTSLIVSIYAGNGLLVSSGDGGPATSAGFNRPYFCWGDSIGSLYVSDVNVGKLRVISGGIITTYAGNGNTGFAVEGTKASSAPLQYPYGVFADSSGNVFVTESDNSRVLKISAGTKLISTVAGNGVKGFLGDGFTATSSWLYNPFGIWMDTLGNSFITDTLNNRIRFLPSNSQLLYTIAGTGAAASSGNDGPATSADIFSPHHVSGNTAGRLLSCADEYAVRMLSDLAPTRSPSVAPTIVPTVVPSVPPTRSPSVVPTNVPTFAPSVVPTLSPTRTPSLVPTAGPTALPSFQPIAFSVPYAISSYAGSVGGSSSGDGGMATAATFPDMCSTFVDSVGTLYITECSTRIRKVDASSNIITTYAGSTSSNSGDGGPVSSAKFAYTYGIWGDTVNRMFIVDMNNNVCRVVSANGIISKYAGGNSGFSGDGGQATSAGFTVAKFVSGDTVGKIFIADADGNRVRVVQTNGIISTFIGTTASGFSGDGGSASSASVYYPMGVVSDASGNVYIVEKLNHVIRMVSSAGICSTFAGTGLPGYNGNGAVTSTYLYYPIGNYLDGAGNLFFADGGNNRFRVISSSLVYTVAGNGGSGSAGDGGQATAATLNNPWAVWGNTASSIFVVVPKQVRKLSPLIPTSSPTVVPTIFPTSPPVAAPAVYGIATFAGQLGVSGFAGNDGQATAAKMGHPYSTFQDTLGNAYIADFGSNAIRVVDTLNIIKSFLGTGSGSSYGNGGPSTSASINCPVGIWKDSLSNMFVSEYSGFYVRKVDSSLIVSIYAGTGNTGSSGDGGPATSASFNRPFHLFGDTNGNLLLTDDSTKIRKIASNGIVSTFAGGGGSGYTSDGSVASSARLSAPVGLFIDTSGTTYFAERYNSFVRKISTGAGILSTFAGNGNQAFTGDGLVATSSSLNNPFAIWLDSVGNAFVSDSFNYRVRFIPALSSLMYTIAGTGTIGSSGNNGPASSAALYAPFHVSGNTAGRLLTSEDDYAVRSLSNLAPTSAPSVVPTTVPTPIPSILPTAAPSYAPVAAPISYTVSYFAGTSSPSTFGDGGQATSAGLTVKGVWSDSTGSVFIADGASRVRKVTNQGIISTHIGSAVAANSGDGGSYTSATLNSPVHAWGDSIGQLYISVSTSLIRKIDNNGIINMYAGNGVTTDSGDGGPATAASFNSVLFVVGDTSGNLFLSVRFSGQIRKVSASSGAISTFAGTSTTSNTGSDNLAATSSPLGQLFQLFCTTTGRLFFAESLRVRYVSSSQTIVTAGGIGSYTAFNGDGIPATAAQIPPRGLWADDASNLFVGVNSNRYHMITSPGGIIYTIAGTGVSGSTGSGAATAATFSAPYCVWGNSIGAIYVTDGTNYVRRFDGTPTSAPTFLPSPAPSCIPTILPTVSPTCVPTMGPSSVPTYVPVVAPISYIRSSFAGTGTSSTTGDGGPATAATMIGAKNAFADSEGNVFIADGYSRIRKVDTENIITTAVGSSNVNSGDGGPVSSAMLSNPKYIWCDTDGRMYITLYSLIRKVDANSIIQSIVGHGAAGSAGDGGPATAALIDVDTMCQVDSNGNLYFTEGNNHRIRMVDNTGIITTIAGTGTGLSTNADGIQATAAQIYFPFSLFLTSSGTLYFAEFYRIRYISASQTVVTVAGSYCCAFNGDGIAATSAVFDRVHGLFIDDSVNIFFGVQNQYRFRMVSSPSNLVYTIAGTGVSGSSGDGGYATASSFGIPLTIWSNSFGTLFVTDSTPTVRILDGNPTSSPTRSPTKSPSVIPTIMPTRLPSNTPTVGPSALPSVKPSLCPSVQPSFLPTVTPTAQPTLKPSVGPTLQPSIGPSVQPSLCPTAQPSVCPSLQPTAVPTLQPSVCPSVLPSVLPSLMPTVAPSTPTIGPTVSPSFAPVVAPVSYSIAAFAGTGVVTTSGDGGRATAAAIFNAYGVFQDSVNSVYIADLYTRVRRVDAVGIISTFAGTSTHSSAGDGGPASSADLNAPRAVWGDSTGRLFIGDSDGCRIRLVSTSGIISTHAGTGVASFTATSANGDGGQATAATINNIVWFVFGDTVGNLFVSDSNNYKVRKVAVNGIISTVVGTGYTGSVVLGAATASMITTPRGLYVNSVGDLYVGFYAVLVSISASQQTLTKFAGTGTGGYTGDGLPATSSKVGSLFGLFVDTSGALVVVDSDGYRVRSVISGVMYNSAGTGSTGNGNGGAATAASFSPLAVWGDTVGNLVVSDYLANVVRKLTPGTPTAIPTSLPPSILPSTTPSTFKPTADPSVVPTAITITVAPTLSPSTLTPSASSDFPSVVPSVVPSTIPVLVSSEVPSVVPSLYPSAGNVPTLGPTRLPSVIPSRSPTNVPTTRSPTLAPSYVPVAAPVGYLISAYAGTGTNSYSGDGGPATAAQMPASDGVFGDSAGNIYSSDGTNRIRKVDASGIISLFAGSSTSASLDGVAATSSFIYQSRCVWADSVGRVFIADYFAGKIRLVSTSGIMSTYCGNGDSAATIEGGVATSVSISRPLFICGDTVGNIYFSDNSYKVRRISLNGIITTAAGTGSYGTGEYGIPATSSEMNTPCGVFVNTDGDLFVADTAIGVIRRVDNAQIITLYAGTGSVGYSGEGMAATNSKLFQVYGIFAETNGIFYLADNGNGRYRSIVSGIIYTIAGSGSRTANTGNDGAATAAGLGILYGVWGDTIGNLFVSDTCSIRKLTYQAPSVTPTAVPSFSFEPTTSFVPTFDPSIVPSIALTRCPSVVPSRTPTNVPTTKTPTLAPSSGSPSFTPSVVPSQAPSVMPSIQPSAEPSVIPTVGPSVIPSLGPTLIPSGIPTTSPTVLPLITLTASPSGGPTVGPSMTPSVFPSLSPSQGPSKTPSTAPSVSPTRSPSDGSSQCPTVSPSVKPSLSPSVKPSVCPSISTTVLPSICPTLMPSVVPILGSSVCPSTQPSVASAVVSSLLPTALPSFIPSMGSTALPIVAPTEAPTFASTVVPTAVPSLQPSIGPTCAPSLLPSMQPSTDPSLHPSLSPSVLSTAAPSTVSPSCAPSESPTIDPSSGMPSIIPTEGPTTVSPSVIPSMSPSLLPSVVPSLLPSVVPSVLPSLLPTLNPTANPSQTPSVTPSKMPTIDPSALPTLGPTATPTLLSASPTLTRFPTSPTQKPSVVPTLKPSQIPVVSPTIKPTVLPTTVKPTQIPSKGPSLKPTRNPTLAPSLKPTNVPSIKPSAKPSVTPSVRPTLIPTRPTVTPTLPTPSISPSPTFLPSVSFTPTLMPVVAPSNLPTVVPTTQPTTEMPSATPSIEPSCSPSYLPSLTPSALPTTMTPSAIPSTVEFYVSHPKATLPSNQSISVVGPSDLSFKIVLPFLSMSSGPFGTVFSNIVLSPGDDSFASYVVMGTTNLPSVVSVTQADKYSGTVAFDTSKRSASVMKDVNGDGYDDLIIGDGYISRCYVMFGSQFGFVNMTNGFTIFGESEGDLTGWSVSGAGDVNNDTLADIIVGAPFVKSVGAMYVIYGRRFNNFDVYLSNLTASQGFVVYGAQKSDYLGISVSNAGDVNGDGCDDVIVGGVMTSLYFAGAAYIVYGGRSLRTMTTLQLSVNDGYKLVGVSYGYFGYSLSAAGDVNKDGLDDVLIGSSPQRSTLVPTTCLVYGSKSVTGDVSLAGLTSSQGVRITGGGVTVSYAGDINHDGLFDVMIGGNFAAGLSETAYIVYSNVTFMSKVTSQPSLVPTMLPVFAPTKIPTRIPSRAPLLPTVVPSRLPSVNPSTTPTAPTDAPTPGVSQPSSQPSSLPSVPTMAPSAEPSEVPTVSPSQEPSESPTRHPTESPSEHPTMLPSIEPSEIPSTVPSEAPTTLGPTTTVLTHAPFSAPTRAPSVQSSMTEFNSYFIEGAAVIDNQLDGNQNYIVNTNESVSIYNLMGNNKYTIFPFPGSKLTIVYLNETTDKIDLTAFKIITEFKQLLISEGSIILTLPSEQIVHILNLHPADVSESNFIFFDESTTKPPETKTTKTLSVVAGVLIAVAGFILGTLLLMRFCGKSSWFKSAVAALDADKFLMVVKYNKNGELFEEIEGTEIHDDDIESYMLGISSSEETVSDVKSSHSEEEEGEKSAVSESPRLSDHTLNSEGEFVHRNRNPSLDDESWNVSNALSKEDVSKDPSLESVGSSPMLSDFSINSDGDFVDKL